MDDYRKITKIVRNMMLYKNKIKQSDLSDNEYEALRYLTKHKNGLSGQDIAFYLNVDKSLVSRILKKLENDEYIAISDNQEDKRKKLIVPLEKSFLLKEENENEEIYFYNEIFTDVSKEEQELFLKTLDKIYLKSKELRKNKFGGLK